MTAIIITIVVSLIISAFCSGMEIAFLRSNRLRIEVERGSSGMTDRILQIFLEHPQQYITTLLVGNNIVLVIFSMKMNELLTPLFATFMEEGALLSLLVTIVATLVVLYIGEYLPKNVFRSNANTLLRALSPFALIMYVVLWPVVMFCTLLTRLLLLCVGVKQPKEVQERTFTRADLDYLVEELDAADDEPKTAEEKEEEEELPSANELQILRNALDFSKVRIRDCFVPRTDLVALAWDTDVETLKKTFEETGFSKIPIFKEDIDNIVGYIHCMEMFEHQIGWQNYIKSIPSVPENYMAQKLLNTFMQEKKSMAVVIDEFGGTAGIVTFEDIVEEIFGEIEDEHDKDNEVSKRLSDTEVLVSARWDINEVNFRFGLHLPESEEYDTLAGLILETAGTIPQVNEVIEIGDYQIKCLKIVHNRIEMVKIIG